MSKLDEMQRHLIETCYQDMQGVMSGSKKHRLRHDELAEQSKQQIKDLIKELIAESYKEAETSNDEAAYILNRKVEKL